MAKGVIDGLLVSLGFIADLKDAKKFNNELSKITRGTKDLSLFAVRTTQALAAMVAITGAIAIKSSKATDAVGQLSRELQIDPEILSKWQMMAELAGISSDKAAKAFSTMSNRINKAMLGIDRSIFEQMGRFQIDTDLDSVEANIINIQKRVQELYASGQGSMARALLSNLGMEDMNILFMKTAEEMKRYSDKVNKIGLVNKDDVENARKIQESFSSIKLLSESIGRTIAKSFGPVLEKGTQKLLEYWKPEEKEFVIPITVTYDPSIIQAKKSFGEWSQNLKLGWDSYMNTNFPKDTDSHVIDNVADAWDSIKIDYSTSDAKKSWDDFISHISSSIHIFKPLDNTDIIPNVNKKQSSVSEQNSDIYDDEYDNDSVYWPQPIMPGDNPNKYDIDAKSLKQATIAKKLTSDIVGPPIKQDKEYLTTKHNSDIKITVNVNDVSGKPYKVGKEIGRGINDSINQQSMSTMGTK